MGTLASNNRDNRFRTPRVAELVAAELRARIVRGDFSEELPREAALLEEFKVSRPSLREAFRILETEGLIEIRRGKIGGAVVRRPTAEAAAYQLGLVMQSEGARLSDLAESRLLIEPACAGLAAAQPEHESIADRLTELVDASEQLLGDDSVEFTKSAQRFHQGIVDLCGNVTMRLMTGVLEAVWHIQEERWAERATEEGRYPDRSLQREVITAHRRIARYIRRGDRAGAVRSMRAHLEHSQPFVDLGDAPIEVVPDSRPGHARRPGR